MNSKGKGQCFARCKDVEAQHACMLPRGEGGGTGSILSNELDISNLRDRIVLPRVGGIDEDGTVRNPD